MTTKHPLSQQGHLNEGVASLADARTKLRDAARSFDAATSARLHLEVMVRIDSLDDLISSAQEYAE